MKNNNYSSKFSLKLYNLCQVMPFLRKLKVILYFSDALLLLFINKPKYSKRKKKEVLIIYNYAFGDGIIWLCSAKHLREIYPKNKYRVTLICQKGLNPLYENEDIFDEVIPFYLTEATFNMKRRFQLYKLLRNKYYDIVIDPIGVGECTTNVFMSRALVSKEKITVLDTTITPLLCPKWISRRIYTKIIEINKKNLSLIEYYSEMIKNLGIPKFEVRLEGIKTNKIDLKLPQKYFIVFPSASTLLKRWPIDRYKEIVKRVYEKTKIPLVLCGTKDDLNSINELKNTIQDVPIYDIACKTSLIEFINVVKGAKYVITNDTSTYHIAVVNQVPVTIITGSYTFDRYVKYDFKNKNKYLKPYIVYKKCEYMNCDNKCRFLKQNDTIWPCLGSITVNEAWKVIEKMIDENK